MRYKIDKRYLLDKYYNLVEKELAKRDINFVIENKNNTNVLIVYRENILGSFAMSFDNNKLEVYYVFTSNELENCDEFQEDFINYAANESNLDIVIRDDEKYKNFTKRIIIRKIMDNFKGNTIIDTFLDIEDIVKRNIKEKKS